MDLHIGVTTSTGAIVEFDRCGLRRQKLDNNITKLTPQSTLHQSSMKNSNSCAGDGVCVGNNENTDNISSDSKWNQSLLVEQVPEEWCEHWDAVLEEVSCKFCGTKVGLTYLH